MPESVLINNNINQSKFSNNIIVKLFKEYLYTFSLYSRQIASTAVLLLIVRYLSIYDFGLFSSYKNIATFCLIFANLDFANYILVSSKTRVKEIKLKISLFIINAILLVIIISICSTLFKLANHFLFFLVLLRTFLDITFWGLILPYFQAARKFNTIASINIIYSSCILIIAVISYFFKFSLVKFLLLNIGIGFINVLQFSYSAKINYSLVFPYIKRFIKMLDNSIWGYMGSTITDYIYAQISSLYVAIFLPKESAALYFAAFTIGSLVSLFAAAQIQKMLPEMINNSTESIKKILKKNLFFVWTILLGILLVLAISGRFILKLVYGQEYYMNAYPILIIFIISNILITNGGIFGAYLTAIGKQVLKVKMKIETSIITLICLCLLHKLGIYGAVISLLISSIYVSIRYTLCSIKLLNATNT